jgi:hypothetical protein
MQCSFAAWRANEIIVAGMIDFTFWLALVLKMAVTAGFAVGAAMVTERAGPTIGALVSTLPIATGPAYVFLALDQDSEFIAQSVLGSIAAHTATGVFSFIYVMLAQRCGMAISVASAVGIWFVVALLLRSVEWSFLPIAGVNLAIFALCIIFTSRYLGVPMPPVGRRWYDVPLRASMVAGMVAAVVGLSGQVGPTLTGLLAVYPIVMTFLMLIFHPRAGGPATAALISNTLWGLVGFSTCLFTLHLATVPLGAPAGLALALAVSIGWNLVVWMLRRHRSSVKPIQP